MAKKPVFDHPEIKAMRVIASVLDPLDPDARRSVLLWVTDYEALRQTRKDAQARKDASPSAEDAAGDFARQQAGA